jgi:hypothetical protein
MNETNPPPDNSPLPDDPGVAISRALRRTFGGFWGVMTGPCRFCGGAIDRWNSGPRQIHPTQEDDGKEGAP